MNRIKQRGVTVGEAVIVIAALLVLLLLIIAGTNSGDGVCVAGYRHVMGTDGGLRQVIGQNGGGVPCSN